MDITAHEILPGEVIRELHAASGGPWGGTKVDERFIQFMKDILGARFIESYQKRSPQQWLTLMIQFERMKKTVSLKVDIALHASLSLYLSLSSYLFIYLSIYLPIYIAIYLPLSTYHFCFFVLFCFVFVFFWFFFLVVYCDF